MKAMALLSPVPIQGIKEATLSNMSKEMEGASFLNLIQQQMDTLSNPAPEEQEGTEILELMQDALYQLNSLLVSFTHVEQHPEINQLQTHVKDLLAALQPGSALLNAPLKVEQQQLQSILEKAKSILQQADIRKSQLALPSDDEQKWNAVLSSALNQMKEMEKALQGMGRQEQPKETLSSKANQQHSLLGLGIPTQRFSIPMPTKVIVKDNLKNELADHPVSMEKLILKSVPNESILQQTVHVEENTLLRMEPYSSSHQQQVIQTSTSFLSSVNQGNKVPVQQIIRYLEPLFLTNGNQKTGESIQKLILQLQPESLGKLDVHIQNHNGQITAQFIVENATAKQAVEEQMTQLRISLQAQGVPVHHLEVIETPVNHVQLFQHQQKQQHEQRTPYPSKGKKAKEYLELEEDLKIQREYNQHSLNTSINYIV